MNDNLDCYPENLGGVLARWLCKDCEVDFEVRGFDRAPCFLCGKPCKKGRVDQIVKLGALDTNYRKSQYNRDYVDYTTNTIRPGNGKARTN